MNLKHWQVFTLFVILSLPTMIEFEDVFYSYLISTVFWCVFVIYYLMLGLELSKVATAQLKGNITLFIINSVIIITATLSLLLFFNGHFSGKGFLGLIVMIYLFYAFFQFFTYPVKTLKSIEQDSLASFSQYFLSLMQVIFLPIGIWWLQPRINKVSESYPIQNKHPSI
ncbi:MAG: hypothetical protein RLP13_13765 [Cytophagales bacterium]